MLNALPLCQSGQGHRKGPWELFEFESYGLARFERPASPKKAVCNPNRTREKNKGDLEDETANNVHRKTRA